MRDIEVSTHGAHMSHKAKPLFFLFAATGYSQLSQFSITIFSSFISDFI